MNHTIEQEQSLNISFETCPSDNIKDLLLNNIYEEAHAAKNFDPFKQFAVLIRNKDNELHGGLTGYLSFGGLYISLLWVHHSIRRQGWGKILMGHAEDKGKAENCHFIILTTMDWQALGFYQKLGYEIEFTRHGYHNNSHMYTLRKDLLNHTACLTKQHLHSENISSF